MAAASYQVGRGFLAILWAFRLLRSRIDFRMVVRSWWNTKPMKSRARPLVFFVFLSSYSNRNTCQFRFSVWCISTAR